MIEYVPLTSASFADVTGPTTQMKILWLDPTEENPVTGQVRT